MEIQALIKLSTRIEDIAKKQKSIDIESVAEVKELISELHGKHGNKVVLILFKLSKAKVLQNNFLIKECISLAALGKPVHHLVQLFIYLILDDSQDTYSVASKQPLSRLFVNQPNSLKCILSSVQEFINIKLQDQSFKNFDIIFERILFPFIHFVIHNGVSLDDLVTELLQIASNFILFHHDNKAFSIVHQAVDVFKNHELLKTNSSKFIQALNAITVWSLSKKDLFGNAKSSVGFDLLWLLLTCCWNNYEANNIDEMFPSVFHIKCLIKRYVMEQKAEAKMTSHCFDEVLFVCSMMLHRSHDSTRYELLQIVYQLLTSKLCDIHNRSLLHLYLPLFTILSEKMIGHEQEKKIQELANKIIHMIETTFSNEDTNKKINDDQTTNRLPPVSYSEILNVAHASLYMLDSFKREPSLISPWLHDLSLSCDQRQMKVKDHLSLVLTYLLLSNEHNIYNDLIQCIIHVVKNQTELVWKFLPVILYVLNERRYKDKKLLIMHALPKLAVSKDTIPMVLKLILTFSTNNELFSISLYLMTDLWKSQPRIYPYVHQLLSKEFNKSSLPIMLWYEWILTRVTCILRVCKQNAHQHGQEMVMLLSSILEELIKDSEDEIYKKQICICLSLLVESLKEICTALVIDIESIWKAVIIKLLSGFSESLIVLQSICSLLSAIPVCGNEKNEVFIDEVLQYLWHLTQHKASVVQSSAFNSLSKFPPNKMIVKYLPQKAQLEVCERLCKDRKDNEAYNPMDEVCPGYAYVLLLHEVQHDALEGYQALVNTVLRDEVDSLPRGLGRRVQLKQADSSLDDVPTILKQAYDTNARPAILPGLTAGLLCCYEATVHGFDIDNPSAKHLIQLKDRYCHTLQNLLHDFTIQQNDWHHVMYAPKSWHHFMTKMLQTCIEGRRAELLRDREIGVITDIEHYEEEVASIKYWVRDYVTDILRKASKGNPKIQGNSILALAGLATALTSHEENEELKAIVADQYISLRHWMVKVADTLMVVFDGNYKSKNKPFQWCQQVSSSKSSASSLLSRCAAVISFSELVHPLLPIDSERILSMVSMIKERLPGQPKAASSNPMHLYIGIGFNLMISKLYREQFQNIVGDNAKLILTTSVELMRQIVFNDEYMQIKDGLTISLGVALSSMLTYDTKKDSQVFVLNIHKKLFQMINELNEADFTEKFVAGYMISFACLTSQAFHMNCLSLDEFILCFSMLKEKITDQFSDTYVAIGILNSTILKGNITALTDSVHHQLNTWKDILNDRSSNAMLKICAIKGIVSSYGIEMTIYGNNESKPLQFGNYMKILTKVITGNSDDIVCNLTSRLLGCCHMSSDNSINGNSNIPSSYDYLKHHLLLSNIFTALSETSLTGPHGIWTNEKTAVLLNALEDLPSTALPPVNWTLVISPLFQVGYSQNVKFSCLKFAIKFATSSVNIALWVSSWLQLTSFLKLSKQHQYLILENTSLLLPCLPNTKQKSLLQEIPNQLLSETTHLELNLEYIFDAWLSVVSMEETLQSTVAYTMAGIDAFVQRLHKLPFNKIRSIMGKFSECVYMILKENWKNLMEKMTPNDTYKYFNIEMLKLIKPLHLDDVICVLDQINQDHLPRFFEILFTADVVSANFVSSLLSYLCNRFTYNKVFSRCESALFYRSIVYLSTNQITVRPIKSLETNNSFNLTMNLEKMLANFLVNETSTTKKVLDSLNSI